MRVHASFFIPLAALFCGCSSDHFKAGHGDIGQFILRQAIVRGGSPVTTNNLPPIVGEWRYSTDKYGVVIRMSREQYPSVEAFLRQAFGEPRFGPIESRDGGRLGEYRLTSKGGGIQFVCDTNCTQITITRPLSRQEFWDTFMKAMQIENWGNELTN
jgi:hypothetical protein